MGKNKAEVFHARFDSRIKHTADIVRKAGTNPDNATINCSIISQGYPPTVSQTQRCSAAILQLAMTMPDH